MISVDTAWQMAPYIEAVNAQEQSDPMVRKFFLACDVITKQHVMGYVHISTFISYIFGSLRSVSVNSLTWRISLGQSLL